MTGQIFAVNFMHRLLETYSYSSIRNKTSCRAKAITKLAKIIKRLHSQSRR
jgi:hypothetical protein